MTEQTKIECPIFLAMNEDGDWAVNEDAQEAANSVAENNGGAAIRTIRLIVKMAPPAITEHEVDVPDEAGETKEVEAEAA
jgi:hypothetical protein